MPGAIDYTKLQIIPDPDTKEWWEATAQSKFLVRKCLDCGNTFFPPGPACRKCAALDVEGKLGWAESDGKGVIYSYIVVVQPILGHLAGSVPYVSATIELPQFTQEDGTKLRLPGIMVNDQPEVAIGLPVELTWDDTAQEGIKAPRWKVSGTAENTWAFPH